MRRILRGRRGQNGQGAVEFALTMPLVFALILGVIELGVAFNAYVTVTNAAREGARAAAVYLYDSSPGYGLVENDDNREDGTGTATPYTDNVRDTVERSLGILKKTLPSFDKTSSVTITYTPDPPVTANRKGDLVTVRVVYRHFLMTGILNRTSIDMTGQASARIE